MAASIRPRIQRHLDRFLVPVELPPIQRGWNPPVESDVDLGRPEATARDLGVDTSVLPVDDVHGGAIAARERLDRLISHRLVRYADDRNTPGSGIQSGLSPYLHFGQISPLEVALAVRNADAVSETARAAFLEELIVRRELALNFTERNPRYDQYEGLPEWARESLAEHANDPRESMYDRETLCEARTHDPFWNAAQREMLETGTMHGYMRMYWGKKILEWSATPEQAFETALWLNNRYELDGRDPNGFAGVAWCFGKHDRGWPERPVFGKIRYMNANGLRRKFDMAPYLARFSGP
jgi:deoxyribodipyrimidine photo-lyase